VSDDSGLVHCSLSTVQDFLQDLYPSYLLTNSIKSLKLKVSKLSKKVHCSLSAMTHAALHASMLRPASQAGPMHESAGVGKLVNAALLSLINEACMNV